MTRQLRVEPWLIISLALSVVANQTFSTVGISEVLLGLSILWIGLLASRNFLLLPRLPLRCLPAILLIASIAISAFVGFTSGASISAVFRAVAPYMILGIAFPYMVSGRFSVDRKLLLMGVLAVAALHAAYLVGVYLFVNDRFDSASHILINRITLADNRTLNPVYLVTAPAAAAIYAMTRRKSVRLLTLLAATLSIIAAFATISRAFAVATLLALLVLLILSAPLAFRYHARRIGAASIGTVIIAGALLLFIPPFSIIPDAMFMRHATQAAAVQIASADPSPPREPVAKQSKTEIGGGRLTDEWPSAWDRFKHGTVLEKIFGIGAGNSFTLKDGTERTYIHNWPLYLLLYQGIFGIVAFTLFIASLSITALVRWWRHNDLISLGSLGILATMYSSSLFFANHKLISFNLLLVVVYLMVMSRPRITIDRR